MGKTPLGVIEVDGGSHNTAKQVERDALNNSILEKSGVPIPRLRTIDSRVEGELATFLSPWVIQLAATNE